jgi:ATP-dependent DNA helicase RecG
LICFNQPYLATIFKNDNKFAIAGDFIKKMGEWQATAFDYESIVAGQPLLAAGRVVPIYSLTKGITQKKLRKILWDYLSSLSVLEEVVPGYLMKKRNLLSFDQTIRNLHFPTDINFLLAAQNSFIYQEFLFFQITVQFSFSNESLTSSKKKYKTFPLAPMEQSFQFKLTAGQKKVVE